MRLVLTCRKEGDKMYIHVDEGNEVDVMLPPSDEDLIQFYENIYDHLMNWFEGRVDRYDNGSYGNNDIGFDIMRVDD